MSAFGVEALNNYP